MSSQRLSPDQFGIAWRLKPHKSHARSLLTILSVRAETRVPRGRGTCANQAPARCHGLPCHYSPTQGDSRRPRASPKFRAGPIVGAWSRLLHCVPGEEVATVRNILEGFSPLSDGEFVYLVPGGKFSYPQPRRCLLFIFKHCFFLVIVSVVTGIQFPFF